MIISGYQGIGKSTLSQGDPKFIDLESGCFWVNGVRSEDWYIVYCQMAEHLSRQGYTVFMSSHKAVREYLKASTERVYCCAPTIGLKDAWIEKLKQRYELTGQEKDKKAYLNAKQCYEENIKDIATCGLEVLWLPKLSYSLRETIIRYT